MQLDLSEVKMSCQKCFRKRIMSIFSHASDLHVVEIPHLNYEHEGYLPYLPNIQGGDDLHVKICLDCGQLQGKWPIDDETVEEAINEGS